MKKKICIGFVDISGLLGIIFQFIKIPVFFKFIVAGIFVGATLYYFYIFISENKTYNREKRIKKVRSFIMNSKNKIVFFGGNLSWANDYVSCIREKIHEGCSVEIYYDNNTNMSNEAKNKLENSIRLLEDNGCKVYKLDQCYSLRCIISDALNDSNNANGIVIEKTKNNIDFTKNRYRISYFNSNDNNMLSTLFFDITKMAEKNSEKILERSTTIGN